MKNSYKLFISLVIPLLVGLAGGLFTYRQIPNWYAHLEKPAWNPPSWIFGPVWTTLYNLMGIAFFLVWRSVYKNLYRRSGIVLFGVQLLLNLAWSFLFFDLHRMDLAFADIVLLWLAIYLTLFFFGQVSPTAAWLLIPYICWVSFAAVLNYTIWHLNQ